MSEWSMTFCDACNYEGYESPGRGVYEGPATSAVYDGWATLERKRMTEPITLSSGYVIEARETNDRTHLCPDCLKDRDTIYNYIGWDERGYDAENYRKARSFFDQLDVMADEMEFACQDSAEWFKEPTHA